MRVRPTRPYTWRARYTPRIHHRDGRDADPPGAARHPTHWNHVLLAMLKYFKFVMLGRRGKEGAGILISPGGVSLREADSVTDRLTGV